MEKKNINITFESSIDNLIEANSSFDRGVMRVCYTGKNQNGSYISKETFERCMKSIYNCPVVCNYDRSTDTIGSHDVELVSDDNSVRIVNITQPVGIVPESSNIFWENVEDDSGTHEYLCADVLLWKRQEAYKKIKENGITAESMEITVKSGDMVDDVYVINDFEFTAFCLLGTAKPCFESAALEVFALDEYKAQFTEMMADVKNYMLEQHSQEVVIDENDSKGGEEGLEDNKENFSEENNNDVKEQTNDNAPAEQEQEQSGKFALASNVIEELQHVLSQEKIQRDWGEYERYCYVDYDSEAAEVYCWDRDDWLLYGFKYSVDGDSVAIDYATKKRKKYAIVDFEGSEAQESPFAPTFASLEGKIKELSEVETKFNAASESIASMESELSELRKFKADTETAVAKEERESVFAQFEDLAGVEAFENLRNDCMKYDVDTLEEKCYAIRGRNNTTAKFSLENKPTKLKVEKTVIENNEPYGGLFLKYKQNNAD